jgi:hypothetical protein
MDAGDEKQPEFDLPDYDAGEIRVVEEKEEEAVVEEEPQSPLSLGTGSIAVAGARPKQIKRKAVHFDTATELSDDIIREQLQDTSDLVDRRPVKLTKKRDLSAMCWLPATPALAQNPVFLALLKVRYRCNV